MGANGNSEFRSHQQYCKHFVYSAEAATVNLAITDRARLQELFEHYTVMAMFSRRYADGMKGASDAGVPKDVIRRRRLFNPNRLELRKLVHTGDRFVYIPHLICIHHQLTVPTDLVANDSGTAKVIFLITADLHLEV